MRRCAIADARSRFVGCSRIALWIRRRRCRSPRKAASARFSSVRRRAIAVSDCSLRSLRFALGNRLFRRHLRTEERVRSLLFTTAARETQRSQPLMLRFMDENEDQSRQVAAYGATAQPAIAARMAPHLRLTQIGAACAAVAVIAATAAVVVFPSFAGAGPGLAWAVGALVSAALMLAICVIQVAVWRRAMASWLGKRIQDLQGEKQLSWIAHLASYAVALGALLTCMAGSAAAGWSSASAVLLAVTLLFVLAAQVLAGVQFLRPSGPPGTLPAHIRRLNVRSRYRND
jgi:hypothetical protein